MFLGFGWLVLITARRRVDQTKELFCSGRAKIDCRVPGQLSIADFDKFRGIVAREEDVVM